MPSLHNTIFCLYLWLCTLSVLWSSTLHSVGHLIIISVLYQSSDPWLCTLLVLWPSALHSISQPHRLSPLLNLLALPLTLLYTLDRLSQALIFANFMIKNFWMNSKIHYTLSIVTFKCFLNQSNHKFLRISDSKYPTISLCTLQQFLQLLNQFYHYIPQK